MEPKSSFPACMDVQRTFDFIWFLTSRSSNSFKFDKAHIERSDSPLSTGIVRCSLMLLTVLLQGSSLHETYSEPFQSISFVLGWTNKASTWRTLDSTKMSRLRTCRVVRTLHFEVVCCFVFRHFSRLPTEPCRDMSKYIVLLCLRHNCIMIRIAPISSPWTTRSAQNQAAWNVSQTVKPCQTMSDPLNCVKLKKTCHESEGNPEESHSEPMESLLIALWIRYFVYDSEVQLLCLVDSQVHLWESLVVRCCLYTVHLITRSCNQVCWQLLLPGPPCKSCKGKKVPGGETRPLPSQAQHILQTDRTRSVEYNGTKFYTLELLQFFEGVFDLQVLVRAAFVRVSTSGCH